MSSQFLSKLILALGLTCFLALPLCAEAESSDGVGPNTESIQMIHDANGNLVERTINGRTTQFEYDVYNRRIAVIDAEGNKIRREYDSNNNLIAVIDAKGNRTEFYYNAINQLIGTKDAFGNITRAQLDAEGNLEALMDSNGGQIKETHDLLNRLTSITNAVGKTTRYEYNDSGGICKRINSDGTFLRYHRNVMGWLTQIEYSDGIHVSIEYDSHGNMTRVKGPHTDFAYVYDANNQLIRVTDNILGKSLSYEYNALGQRQTSVDGDGNVTEYRYDASGRLSSMLRNGKIESSYEYDQFGHVVKQVLGNGVTINRTYDSDGTLLDTVHRSPFGKLLSRIGYERDAEKNIARETRSLLTPEGRLETSIIEYRYDAIDQLVSETRIDGQTRTVIYSHQYEYNALNNRTRKTLTDGTTIRYEYDAAGRLIKEVAKKPLLQSKLRVFNAFATKATFEDWRKSDGLTKNVEYEYDDNGNLIRERLGDEVVSYEYDIEGRLVAIESPQGRTEYLLSPDGKRVGIVKDGYTVRVMHDGMDVSLELGERLTRYLSEPGIDQLLLQEQDGKKYYYHRGTANSVFQLSDESGKVVNTYDYDAYGEPALEAEAVENPYKFSSRREERQHVYYFRERLYSSRTGRFLSVDPLRASDANRSLRIGRLPENAQSGQSPFPYELRLTTDGYSYSGKSMNNQSLNKGVQDSPLFQQRLIAATTGLDVTGYVYVGNSPTNHTDPTGEAMIWNPVSGSITSGCVSSGCLLSLCGVSGCGASGCTASGCIGSACGGSGCGGSACGGSACTGSVCVGSGCAVSVCLGSVCAGSGCAVSVCVNSNCVGSGCAISMCVGSTCLGSGCYYTTCQYSACISSSCSNSSCSNSGCSNSSCSGRSSSCSGS